MNPCQPCGSCHACVAFHGVAPINANAQYHRRQLRSRSGLQHPCVAPTRALRRVSRVTGNSKCPKSSSTVTECPSFIRAKVVSCCRKPWSCLKCYPSCSTTSTSSARLQTGVRHYAFKPNFCTDAWLCWSWSSENTGLPCCLGSACSASATTGTLTLITGTGPFAHNYPAC